MAEFESWQDYHTFAYFVRCKARHILDTKSQRFLEAVLETSEKRRGSIQRGSVLWRSQLDNSWSKQPIIEDGMEVDSFEVPAPADVKRMIPFADRATEGRVNAKGIPCLYLSTDRDTAMAEVRPWIGSYVSVGQFTIFRDLTVVDCSSDLASSGLRFEGAEPEPGERERLVWGRINRAFSEPVTRSDDVADYAPTQVLAEAFRVKGFDGIVYGSKVGVGKTVAIFDVAAADLINCHLYEVESINFKFSMAGNPYFIAKYYPDVVDPTDEG